MNKLLILFVTTLISTSTHASFYCEHLEEEKETLRQQEDYAARSSNPNDPKLLKDTAYTRAQVAKYTKYCEDYKPIEAAEKAEAERVANLPGARIGMTKKQVIEKTSWGKPNDINITITKYGKHEQWVYGQGSYLYFENGKLTAIQN